MPQNRYNLKSIEIAGFRGYRDPKLLDFDGGTCLFFGGNRSGKSSTLGAIEWCMFGEFTSLRGEKTGTLDELVNDHSQRIKITLELKGAEGVVKIIRTKQRGAKKTKLELTTPDGNTLKEEDAQKMLYRLLGLELDDFTRAVYLHQEDIRDLVVGDRETRSVAMDRLLGLDQLRNLSEGLESKPIRDSIKGIQSLRDKIVSIIKGHLQEAQKHHKEAAERAAQEGLTTSRHSLDDGKSISKGIFGSLAEIAEEVELEIQKPQLAENWMDLNAHAKLAKTSIEKIRKRLPEAKKLNELTEMQTKISGLKSEYAAAVSTHDLAVEKVQKYETRHGNEDSINKEISAVQAKIRTLDEERDQVDAKQKVIKDALKYLDEFTSIDKCPVCGLTMKNRDGILEHLRKEAKEKIGLRLLEIDEKIKKEGEKEDKLEEFLEELGRLVRERTRASLELDAKVVDISTVVGRPIKPGENVCDILKGENDKITKQILKLQKPLAEREQNFIDLDSQISQLLALAEVLNKKQRMNELFKLQKSKEIDKADEVLKALGTFDHVISMVGESVRGVQTELAPKEVNRAMPAIKDIYNSLVAHPYYCELLIEVEQSTRGALKNIYNIKAANPKDGGETLVSQRFSTGDMNCVALSVFLGLAKQDTYSHTVNFLMLDDPTQNISAERKKKLVDIFAEIMQVKQILVSSHDEELQNLLSEACDKNKTKTFRFDEWDEKGVKVREA